ncbi:MAG TPA: hypothetical protein VN610_01735 [Bryobacteraceae bacterium]|nr:hypothetical protein [Bryobacteraceae bacterium]
MRHRPSDTGLYGCKGPFLVDRGMAPGAKAPELRLPGLLRRRSKTQSEIEEYLSMLDFFYILIAILFFVACWAFTKACDRL